MRYFITGGAGFIGSHLTEKLLNEGHSVTVIDNLSTGKVENLFQVRKKIEFIQGQILDRKLIEKLVAKSDYVVHLAAALGVLNIVSKPLESLKTNIQGTEVILEASLKFNKPVLIASTSEVYGKNDKVPLNEEDDRIIGHPLISRWSYSEAKAVDESLGYFYFRERELPVRIIRFFNTVGPRQVGQYGMVVPRFVSAALKNDPITVYGTGQQIRCFCHVVDAVTALQIVMSSEQAIGQVFNVGNNQQVSIEELAHKIIKFTNSKSEVLKIPYWQAYPKGFEDIQRRVPDISKIKRVLGWVPQIDLDQIIEDVVTFQSG